MGLVAGFSVRLKLWKNLLLLVRSCANVFVRLADEIYRIIVESDSSNHAGEVLAPVLPHQMVSIKIHTIVATLQQNDCRLKSCYANVQMKKIDQEFSAMKREYGKEPALNKNIDAMIKEAVSLEDARAPFCSLLQMLK